MRGHEGIIRLRLAKLRPEAVFINDYPCDTNWEDFGDAPTVCIHGDDPEALDWRYLVGLTVFIHGSSEQRVRWFKRGLDSGRPQDCDTFAAASL